MEILNINIKKTLDAAFDEIDHVIESQVTRTLDNVINAAKKLFRNLEKIHIPESSNVQFSDFMIMTLMIPWILYPEDRKFMNLAMYFSDHLMTITGSNIAE